MIDGIPLHKLLLTSFSQRFEGLTRFWMVWWSVVVRNGHNEMWMKSSRPRQVLQQCVLLNRRPNPSCCIGAQSWSSVFDLTLVAKQAPREQIKRQTFWSFLPFWWCFLLSVLHVTIPVRIREDASAIYKTKQSVFTKKKHKRGLQENRNNASQTSQSEKHFHKICWNLMVVWNKSKS